jgi:myo-inositol-1(or 4)-monophosphatase
MALVAAGEFDALISLSPKADWDVAAGEFDAMISLSPKADWDVAAGDLMIHEAGGRVTTREGDSLIYNREKPDHRSVICAGPRLHACLLARLHDFRLGP